MSSIFLHCLKIIGIIIFSLINYQEMRDAPTNYQLDQNRAFNYHNYILCPILSIRVVKIDDQQVT